MARAHLHFSFADGDSRNVSFDASTPSQASPFVQSFIAGVMDHMPALVAYTAPSPVSYLRLGPHHWNCGFASPGSQAPGQWLQPGIPAGRCHRERLHDPGPDPGGTLGCSP